MMPREGTIIADRYRLERKVGGGRVAAMWLVRDQVTESACAVKLLHRSMNEHSEALTRFSLEDRLARELTGAYFPERVGSGSWQSMRYIAWRWYEGECLRAMFDRNPKQDVQTVNSIAQETCNALSMVHGAGYTHGDLKPENLFFAERGEKDKEASRQLKLLGFGVASRLSRPLLGAQGRRTPGQIVGTPLYLSPELILGRVPRGGQADLWALAVIVYEALTGRAPFLADDLAGVLAAILEKQAPKPSSIADKLPGSFDLWWAQVLQQGFATPAEFATSLSRALAPALRSSRTQRSASLPAAAGELGEVTGATVRSVSVAASPSAPSTAAGAAARSGIPRAAATSKAATSKAATSKAATSKAATSKAAVAEQGSDPGAISGAASWGAKLSRPTPAAADTAASTRTGGASPAALTTAALTTAAVDDTPPTNGPATSGPAPAAAPAADAGANSDAVMASRGSTDRVAASLSTTAAVPPAGVGGTTSPGIASAEPAPRVEDSSPQVALATPRAPAVATPHAPGVAVPGAPAVTVPATPVPRAAAARTSSAGGASGPKPLAEVASHGPAPAPTPRAAAVAKKSGAPGSGAEQTIGGNGSSNAALFREAVAAATDAGRAHVTPPRPHSAARPEQAPFSTDAASRSEPASSSSEARSRAGAQSSALAPPLSLGISSTAPGIGPAAVAMIRALQNAADAAANIRVVNPRASNFAPLPSPLSDFASTGSRKTLVGITPPIHSIPPRAADGVGTRASSHTEPSSPATGTSPLVTRSTSREASAIEGAPCKTIELSGVEDASDLSFNALRRAGHPTVPFARPRAARRTVARDMLPHDSESHDSESYDTVSHGSVPDPDPAFEMDRPLGTDPWTMRTTRTLRIVLTDSGHRPHLIAGLLVCGAAALVIFALGHSQMAGTGALGQSTNSLEPPGSAPNAPAAAEGRSPPGTPELASAPSPQLGTAGATLAAAPSPAPESAQTSSRDEVGGAEPSGSVPASARPPAPATPARLTGKELAPGLVLPGSPTLPPAPQSKPDKPKAAETAPSIRVAPPGGALAPTHSPTAYLPGAQKPGVANPLGAPPKPAPAKPGAKKPGADPATPPRPANGDFDFGI